MLHLLRRVGTIAASGLWLTLATLAVTHHGLNLLMVLVVMQYVLTAWRLVFRREMKAKVPLHTNLLAWTSALLPLTLRGVGESSALASLGLALQIAGLLLALWALWSLGRAFGIAPADRGLIRHGPYRWLRHPAYAGELLALTGFGLAHPSLWNGIVLTAIALSLVARLGHEERAIAGYTAYAAQVRWRLMPGVW